MALAIPVALAVSRRLAPLSRTESVAPGATVKLGRLASDAACAAVIRKVGSLLVTATEASLALAAKSPVRLVNRFAAVSATACPVAVLFARAWLAVTLIVLDPLRQLLALVTTVTITFLILG